MKPKGYYKECEVLINNKQMPTVAIILNSPAGSGKDVVAQFLKRHHQCHWMEFKTRLIEITTAVFGVSVIEWEGMYTRENKDTPHWKLKTSKRGEWMSPRQALILISEEVIKPNMGSNYFGLCAANSLKENHFNVFSDGGFVDEILSLIDVVGEENIFKIYIDRDGCQFDENDSRKELPDIMFKESYTIDNNNSLNELYVQVEEVFEHIVNNHY